MNAPLFRRASLLIAFVAICLVAPATASATVPSRHQQATLAAKSPDRGRSDARGGSRSAVATGRAVRRHNRRLVRIRRKSHRAVGIEQGVAVASSAESPEVLFRGDFDAGFAGWHLQSLSERATLISSGAFEGTGAARFEVRQGDVEPDTGSQRSEVSGPTFKEGEDLYFRDAIRVPSGNTFSAPWQIVQQLHEEDWDGSPGMAVFLDNKPALRLGPGDSSRTFWQSSPLQSDRWYDLVYRVNLSQDPATGFVEVWLDGVQQTLANGQTRAYGQTIQMPETYLKAGIYRSKSSTGTSIVEHDAITVGTSYAAVTAG